MVDAVTITTPAATPEATNPAQAPPAAPVAAAAPTPAPAPTPEAPKADGPAPITYEATGDVGLDMALNFVGKLGMGPEHPALDAALKGDFSLIKAQLAGMGAAAQGWEQYVALAEKAFSETATKEEAKLQSIGAAIHSAVGGEAEWKTIQEWAGKNATPEEKAAINAMLTADAVQARAAAVLLKQTWEAKATDRKYDPASAVRHDASAHAPSPNTSPLTRRQAVEQIEALRRTHGASFDKTPEYAAIHARTRR